MENIQQEFLTEAILKLENLSLKLSNESLNEDRLREIFRLFHTLKGTAQTFDFNVAGKLAHELENLLHAAQLNQLLLDEEFTSLLQEGTKALLETFRCTQNGGENYFPTEFVQRLRSVIPNHSIAETEDVLDKIPPEMFNKLSVQESNILSAAIAEGKELYSIEVEFSLLDFAEKFRSLREALQKDSQIIATFPKTKVSSADKIGFHIYFVSHCDNKKIAEIIKPFNAKLIITRSSTEFTDDPHDFLKQAVLAGKKAARRLGKDVEFTTETVDLEIPGKYLNLISECLLHLVRNAVDHAIETSGEVKIQITSDKDNLILRVSDNGCGLDASKVRAAAIKKGIISADQYLTGEETFKLIFAHGFSTAEKISEISGRGVGLDIVQENIKKMNGSIHIESKPEKGTVFEILLPRE